MGIIGHFENLRKEPPHVRKRFALLYSGIVTAVIFAAWLSVLLPQSLERSNGTRTAESGTGITEEVRKIYGEVSGGYGEIKEEVVEIGNEVKQTAAALQAVQATTTTAASADVWDAPVDGASNDEYDFGN